MTYNELSVMLNFPKIRLEGKMDKKTYQKMIECNAYMFKASQEEFREFINKCNDTIQMYFLMRAPKLFQYIKNPSREVSILAVCLDKNNIFLVKKEDSLLKDIVENYHGMKLDVSKSSDEESQSSDEEPQIEKESD